MLSLFGQICINCLACIVLFSFRGHHFKSINLSKSMVCLSLLLTVYAISFSSIRPSLPLFIRFFVCLFILSYIKANSTTDGMWKGIYVRPTLRTQIATKQLQQMTEWQCTDARKHCAQGNDFNKVQCHSFKHC